MEEVPSSPAGRVHQNILDAKAKDEEVAAANGDSNDSPVSATRKKLEQAVIMDTDTDPNTAMAETKYLAHSISEALVDDVFSKIMVSMSAEETKA